MLPSRSWVSFLSAISLLSTPSLADQRPWAHYLTEPHMRASKVTVLKKPDNYSVLEDGYIWITPYFSDYKHGSFGPHIFTNDGTLIWCGNDTAQVRAMDAHVCDFMGDKGTHICYNDALPIEQAGHSAGVVRFFDNTYTQVDKDFGATGGLRAPDIHELNTPAAQNGTTFIVDIYERKDMDLSPYKGPQAGFVLDGCFQEVDMISHRAVFTWCALDHINIWDTYMYLHEVGSKNFSLPIAGNGQIGKPWDFFHINAIAKNLEGDYAVSARHLNTIFKIAGPNNVHGREPGEIIWRLGGKNSDFVTRNFNFSRQHTVRFHRTAKSETVISLFDNAFDGWAYSAKWSSGKLISLNNETMEATLLHQYDDPNKKLSFSQGSMQILQNGNVFMGWGNQPFFSEHTFDGTLLYHATYSGGVESFRIWKFPWVGHPKTKPKLLSYAFNCKANLYAYVSWNGATEVTHWRFYTSWGTLQGPWHNAGTFPKSGFETFVNLSSTENPKKRTLFAPYAYVEALDKNGHALKSSEPVETFIPNSAAVEAFQCDEIMCKETWFEFNKEHSCAWECSHSHVAAFWFLILCVCTIELVNWALTEFGWRWLAGTNFSWIYEPNSYANGSIGNGPAVTRGYVVGTAASIPSRIVLGFSNLLGLLGFSETTEKSSAGPLMSQIRPSSTSTV